MRVKVYIAAETSEHVMRHDAIIDRVEVKKIKQSCVISFWNLETIA